MFSNDDFEPVGFESAWKTERSCANAEVQTSQTVYQDGATETAQRTQAEVQTVTSTNHTTPEVDYDKLASWLTRITPHVLRELDEADNSRAFDGYSLQSDDGDSEIKLLHVLTHPQLNLKNLVSSVTWSSTGGVIALGLCAPEHADWCDHTGSIFLYQINRQDFKPNIPSRTLEVASCVTVLSAHPTESYILACGTYTGEVIVWNLQRDEAMMLGSSSLHNEAVSHMEWIRNINTTQTRPTLVTTARDGTVILWDVRLTTNSLTASQGFVLQSETTEGDVGIVCATFCSRNPTQFVAGVEGGSVLLCSTLSLQPARRNKALLGTEIKSVRNPVEATLVGHKGAVTSVKWVPDKLDTFLTCGTDSELHIYSSSQLAPQHIIFLSEVPLGLSVSPAQSHLVVTWGTSGVVHVHNIHSRKEVPSLKLEDRNDNTSLSAVCFSSSSSRFIAVGDIKGQVRVWKVPFDKFDVGPVK